MTEAEARALLRDWPGVGGVDAWIAGRRWHATPDGWTVDGTLQGWRFERDRDRRRGPSPHRQSDRRSRARSLDGHGTMTEADARHLLWRWPGADGLEAWMAKQPWEAAPSGWAVSGELQGWQFRIEVLADGLRIRAGEPGAVPAVWTVTG